VKNDVFLVVKDIIEKVISSLPGEFKDNIKNAEFIIEDCPSEEFLKAHGFRETTLLGLYVGIPLNKRSIHYNWVLPDRIYIFVEPIFRASTFEGIPLRKS